MLARVVEGDKLRTITDVAEMCAALDSKRMIWVELEAQCKEADDLLVKTLDIHPLTIEDIWANRSQPKLEDYRNYLYVIIHGVRSARRGGAFDLVEIDIV